MPPQTEGETGQKTEESFSLWSAPWVGQEEKKWLSFSASCRQDIWTEGREMVPRDCTPFEQTMSSGGQGYIDRKRWRTIIENRLNTRGPFSSDVRDTRLGTQSVFSFQLISHIPNLLVPRVTLSRRMSYCLSLDSPCLGQQECMYPWLVDITSCWRMTPVSQPCHHVMN